MPLTLAERQARVDAWLDGEEGGFSAFQASFLSGNGRLCQLLETHSNPPSGDPLDDAPAEFPDRTTEEAQGVAKLSWGEIFPSRISDPLPCSLRCDIYQAPTGWGWTIVATIHDSGTLWERWRHMPGAPESWREQPWRPIE